MLALEGEVVLLDQRKNQRIQSSLTLLLDACRNWAGSFENSCLVDQISDMEFVLSRLDLADCSENSVDELEKVTVNLIANMDKFLKSIGQEGLEIISTKH